jgi:hypothetical protein
MAKQSSRNKGLLFTSIAVLSVGIILKATSDWNQLSILLITLGALGKLLYLRQRISSGNYTPGIELVFLSIGLTLFLSGLYLKSNPINIPYQWFTYSGILLKISFIILFIRKARKSRMKKKSH